MNREQSVKLVQDTFKDIFDTSRFTYFLKNLLNQYDESKAFEITSKIYIKEMYREYIASYQRLGTYTDSDGHTIDLLIVHLQKETSLERARTSQRNFVASYLKDRGEKDAALVAFVSPNLADWRFSLIKMEYRFEEGRQGRMKVKEEFTPARRWSFLVGINENSHTAQNRLAPIIQEDRHNPTLRELGEAFNIEKVTKEFFEKYRGLFFRVKEELDALCKQQISILREFEKQRISTADFAKKLLGQIVFLYFLQKKGWFGVHRDKQWGSGSKHFLRELFDYKHAGYLNFFDDLLEPLFYEALRLDRRHDDDYYSKLNCRIPFLNGGLFDPINGYDWVHTDIMLPDEVFSNALKTKEGDRGNGILDIFDRYNFTVKEDEPLEKEVAVDPEMLGKVFENLLEVKDRKSKGTYYTPREIVYYMCRQSLIQYLDTALNNTPLSSHESNTKRTNIPSKTIRGKGRLNSEAEQNNSIVSRGDLEILFRSGESVAENEARVANRGSETGTYSYKLPESIRKHAQTIDDKLANIKVCDPAVGSGAFPVGMMSEIVRVRQTLSSYIKTSGRTTYRFKRDCIQHALYGVDIDPGAVEIAKLRLWLSLVVDEEDMNQIKPLPNLDYKIVCGHSLLSVGKLFTHNLFLELERLKPLLFDETNPQKKDEYKQKIDKLIEEITNGHTDFDFEAYFSEVFHDDYGFDVVIGNPPYVSLSKIKSQAHSLKEQGFATYSKTTDIYCLFYEKGIQILKNLGVLCYITSNSWMRTKYGESLRKYFAEKTNPLVLINFEDARIFDEAIVESNILITQKVPFQNALKAAAFTSDFNKNTPIAEYFAQKFVVLQELRNDGWIVGDSKTLDLKQKIEQGSILLKEFKSSINRGVTSGFNEAFYIKSNVKNDLLQSDINNNEIIKPLLRGKDVICKYKYKWADYWIIFTRRGIDIEEYPTIKNHLLQYYDNLRPRNNKEPTGRKPGHYEWYEIQDNTAYYHEFKEAKIIWGELSDEQKFAYDEDSHFLNNTIFMMTGENLKYLLAILNSRLSTWYFEQISTTSGMGTNRWLKYKVEQMPIKRIPLAEQRPFEILADYVIFLKKIEDIFETGKEKLMASFFEQVIDGCVYELYFKESMKHSEKDILQFLYELPEINTIDSDQDKLTVIKPVFAQLYEPNHPVSQRLYYMDSVKEIRIIKGLEVYDT